MDIAMKRDTTKKLETVKTTKTTDFLLPLLGKSKNWYGKHLVNAYLSDSSVTKKRVNSISLLLKYNGNTQFEKLEQELMSWDTYVDSYELLKGQFIMYVFDIPEELLEDYFLILKGKYSEISMEAKKLLLAGRANKSPMPYILRKSSQLRDHWEDILDVNLGDQDVWSVFEIKDEIFSLDDFPIKPSVL
jgi:hypothetical protein